MDAANFVSSAEFIEKPLDCRRLVLAVNFHQLEKEQVADFCSRIVHWLFEITGSHFVGKWYINGKSASKKHLQELLHNGLTAITDLSFGFDAYRSSKIVSNVRTMNSYQRYIRTINPIYMFGWDCERTLGSASIDYPAYIEQIFPDGRPDIEAIPELIHRIFCEPRRKQVSLHSNADCCSTFSAKAYEKHPDLFYGKAIISFSVFCLQGAVDDMANMLSGLAINLAESFHNINAHVGLRPESLFQSPYMRYFGSHMVTDGSHKEAQCSVDEWYPSYYLCDVAWLNILSPLVKQHISFCSGYFSKDANITFKELNNGGLVIGCRNPASQYSVSDARVLKRYLMPALYPGRSAIPLRGLFPRAGEPRIYDWCPRSDWAIVPVEEGEIQIIGSDIVFDSLNSRSSSFYEQCGP